MKENTDSSCAVSVETLDFLLLRPKQNITCVKVLFWTNDDASVLIRSSQARKTTTVAGQRHKLSFWGGKCWTGTVGASSLNMLPSVPNFLTWKTNTPKRMHENTHAHICGGFYCPYRYTNKTRINSWSPTQTLRSHLALKCAHLEII